MSELTGMIRKSKKIGKFTVVPNEILRNPELSWKAKGLMAYLLGMSDDWVVYKKDLSSRSKDGYDSTIVAFKELITAGFIEEKKVQGTRGRFTGWEYIIHDTPTRENPESENPPTRDLPKSVFTEIGKSPANNTINSSSTKEIPINKKDIDKSISIVGDESPTDMAASPAEVKKKASDLPMTERCKIFVAEFNKIKMGATGSLGKFQATKSVLATFRVRIKDYEAKQILHAIKMAFKDKHHIETNFMYLTPDFILREKILERYINIEENVAPVRKMVY